MSMLNSTKILQVFQPIKTTVCMVSCTQQQGFQQRVRIGSGLKQRETAHRVERRRCAVALVQAGHSRLGSTPRVGAGSGGRARGRWVSCSASGSGEVAVTASAQTAPEVETTEVVIVGGGVAGLACAKKLHEAGVEFVVLEAADGWGGRVRTDVKEGFLLDRGFQIFLTSYPEAQAALDYGALDLQPFYAGAMVRHDAAFHRISDPFRHPLDAAATLLPTHPIGSVLDKARVGLLRALAVLTPPDQIFLQEETTILRRLTDFGFSQRFIDQFFRPFLGGIFFDTSLGTTSRLLTFVMRMLALGANALPAGGIGAVSDQLAAGLPPAALRLNSPVTAVTAQNSEQLAAARTEERTVEASLGVVVAADGPSAARLLGPTLPEEVAGPADAGAAVGSTCVYFAAPSAPSAEPILYLNGEGAGIVNNCTFISNVAPSYAPAGQALVSASVIGVPDLSDEELVGAVKDQLAAWFGQDQVSQWRALDIYRIPFSQPNQAPPTNLRRSVDLGSGLYVCGDHRHSATLDGALLSGRLAAEAILEQRASK